MTPPAGLHPSRVSWPPLGAHECGTTLRCRRREPARDAKVAGGLRAAVPRARHRFAARRDRARVCSAVGGDRRLDRGHVHQIVSGSVGVGRSGGVDGRELNERCGAIVRAHSAIFPVSKNFAFGRSWERDRVIVCAFNGRLVLRLVCLQEGSSLTF